MERTLYADLVAWKNSPRRKPLLLRGARQTGKTFLLQQLGEREYDRIVYCNFEAEPALASFFRRDLDPHRILTELALYKGQEIRLGKDLLVFDEVQVCSDALNSLKYFQEQAADHHVAAAGSLLGVRLSRPGSFPVGKVSFLELHPMSFAEFLRTAGKPQYVEWLAETDLEPLPDAVHDDLIHLLRRYYFVGGMPEAVQEFVDNGDAQATRQIHREILDSYVLDFAKHAPPPDIPKLGLVWDSIPRHLARENKKFVFSALRKGARGREYENALKWLQDAGLIRLSYAVSTGRHPLKHYADHNCFKVFPLDVGLLSTMSGVSERLLVEGDRLFTEYRGALAEAYVAQQLVATGTSDLHYWRSTGGKAELDFLCEMGDTIVPIEVKAGRNPHSKSLKSYDRQFAPPVLIRTSLLNLRLDGKICNVPLYAVPWLSRLALSRRQHTEISTTPAGSSPS